MRAAYEIARQEFFRALTYPLVPVVLVIVLIIAWLFGAGGAYDLSVFEESMSGDALIFGLGQSWAATSIICTVMAIFLGATSIPYERWNNSLNVLLTKPLYRRDFVIGKFMGLSGFMLLFNTFTLLLIGLLMIAYFRMPQSGLEFAWRLAAYIIIMSLSCSVVIALNMLFSAISKNMLFVTSASMVYVFFDWIWYTNKILGGLSVLTPMGLYSLAIHPFTSPFTPFNPLFNTVVSFNEWFSAALPFLAMLLIEMLVFLFVGIYLFSREDTV